MIPVIRRTGIVSTLSPLLGLTRRIGKTNAGVTKFIARHGTSVTAIIFVPTSYAPMTNVSSKRSSTTMHTLAPPMVEVNITLITNNMLNKGDVRIPFSATYTL